ncbi:NAD(P)-dependent oxidoreductase [uncultured Vibrio sp.]|uniref:NAD(P)-dependent oxidoreductase n=1 Tax=uncultured Vibrio sp. TaxID=114054 RepID=UPI0025E4D30D|nr:NAD(P)H-binding protein [uncultured Vibrio sp.]
MENKKLLILGASGGVGAWAVEIASKRGYQVRVLVRPSTHYQAPEGVEVMRGEVLDRATMEQAMEGQDLVISCLGIKREQPNNPWAKVVSPTDLAERSMLNIVAAMNKHNISRIVAISAAGVAESFSQVSWLMKLLIRKSNVNVTFQDFEKMENILKQSDADSLTVRPVGLVDKQSAKKASLIHRFNITSQISKQDVAEWMLDAIKRPMPFKTSSEMIGW